VTPERGGDVAFGVEDPFTTAEGRNLATSTDRLIRSLVFRGLSRIGPGGAAEPELAASWEMLRGGSEWVVHIRPGVNFTNQRPVEARHVVASWERLITEQSPHAWLLDPVQGVEEVRAGRQPHASGLVLEDGLTLRVVLTAPRPDLPIRMAHPALGVSAHGVDESGAGPFEIGGIPRPGRILLRANPEYFRQPPFLDEILFVRGESALPRLLDTGELDGAVILPGVEPDAGPGRRLFTHAVPRVYLLGLNRAVAPFSGAETSRAFLASLDRWRMAEETGGRAATLPARILPALEPGRDAERVAAKPLARASALGRVEIVAPEGDDAAFALVGKIQAGITRAGGRVTVRPVRPADIAGVLARREYHLFVLPLVPPVPDLLLGYEEVMRWNRSIPADLTARIQEVSRTERDAASGLALAVIDEALQEGGYLVPLGAFPRRMLIGRGVCGLRTDLGGTLEWPAIWVGRAPGRECD
jgi:hypothetical protein